MTVYTVTITVSLKEGILDPEASTIRRALADLGFPTLDLKTSRQFTVRLDAASAEEARSRATAMCERLLANPVIHHYEVEVLR